MKLHAIALSAVTFLGCALQEGYRFSVQSPRYPIVRRLSDALRVEGKAVVGLDARGEVVTAFEDSGVSARRWGDYRGGRTSIQRRYKVFVRRFGDRFDVEVLVEMRDCPPMELRHALPGSQYVCREVHTLPSKIERDRDALGARLRVLLQSAGELTPAQMPTEAPDPVDPGGPERRPSMD